MSAFGEALSFLLSHLEILELLRDAIDGGVSHDALKRAIKAEMIANADAEMRRELGSTPGSS
jgi:hypothetical protein